MKTENLAIMFTDVKGFTSKTSAKSRAEIDSMIDVHDTLIRPIFKKFKGNVVKTIGDAFLVTFTSPTDAVLCGMEIQRVLDGYNEEAENENIEVRVAINAGEVNVRESDVFGEPVNIAARIEGIAEAGEIYFTEAVYLSMNKQEIPSAEIGHRYLKGIPHEIKVYKVIQEGQHSKRGMKIPFVARGKPNKKKTWLLIGMGLLIFVVFIAALGGNNNSSPVGSATMEISDEQVLHDNPEKVVQQMEKAIQNGNKRKANQILERLEKQDLSNMPPEFFVLTSYLYETAGRPEEMIYILWEAVDKDPQEKRIWEHIHEQADKGVDMFGDDTEVGRNAIELEQLSHEHID